MICAFLPYFAAIARAFCFAESSACSELAGCVGSATEGGAFVAELTGAACGMDELPGSFMSWPELELGRDATMSWAAFWLLAYFSAMVRDLCSPCSVSTGFVGGAVEGTAFAAGFKDSLWLPLCVNISLLSFGVTLKSSVNDFACSRVGVLPSLDPKRVV